MMRKKGVSLVELLLIVATVGFLIFLINNIPNSINLVGKAGRQSKALEIAKKQIEDKRATNFINLANGETIVSDPRLAELPAGSGQVTISDCDLTVCPNGENAKQVSVVISWQESQIETVQLDTLISAEGLNQ